MMLTKKQQNKAKAIDGKYYVVEAWPDSKAKRLAVITAYISKMELSSSKC